MAKTRNELINIYQHLRSFYDTDLNIEAFKDP